MIITEEPVTEPTSGGSVKAAILTLITDSGGAVEADVVVNVTAGLMGTAC